MIKQFNLKHFQTISEMKTPPLPGITVFVGRNDTGKTGILKLLYASLKALENHSLKQAADSSADPFRKTLSQKLWGVFEPPLRIGLGALVEKSADEKLFLELSLQSERLKFQDKMHFSFGSSTVDTISSGNCSEDIQALPANFRTLFIPPKEVLTGQKAIQAARNIAQTRGFDDTYHDLIQALSIPTVPLLTPS